MLVYRYVCNPLFPLWIIQELSNTNHLRPKGDFIVTYHPAHPNLFLATGGSGHAFKFFPVIGDKVVDGLEGKLDPELKELWAWPESCIDPNSLATEDGSRSGAKGLRLLDELAKGRKAARGSML